MLSSVYQVPNLSKYSKETSIAEFSKPRAATERCSSKKEKTHAEV